MRLAAKALFYTGIAILIFVGFLFLANWLVVPALPKQWQTTFVWFLTAGGGTVVALAAIAQITGFSLRDLLRDPTASNKRSEAISRSLSNPNLSDSILLQSSELGSIRTGDIFQSGSRKVIMQAPTPVQTQRPAESLKVEEIMREIQLRLYSDNADLPYVLTLCLDLASQLGLSDDYSKWLQTELTGFLDYGSFQRSFASEDAFETWMNVWAAHRRVNTHVYAASPDSGGFRLTYQEVPFLPVVIAYRVSEIVEQIARLRDAKVSVQQFSLRSFPPEEISRFHKIINQYIPVPQIPPDLEPFVKVADLQGILDSIRDKVLLLLKAAREQLSRGKNMSS